MQEKTITITAAAKCDAGERNNEDSAYIKMDDSNTFVAVIADGVGGLNDGEIASRYITKAVEVWFRDFGESLRRLTIEEVLTEMERVTIRIHEELLDIASECGKRFGSTMTFAIIGRKKYAIVQVGDSRAYMHDGSWVTLITKDQTVAEYEKETGEKLGHVPEQRKAHTLLQCMGMGEISPKTYTGVLPRNFDILLCSDGLSNTLTEVDIKREVKESPSCATALNRMIRIARTRGEKDNITGILIRRRG